MLVNSRMRRRISHWVDYIQTLHHREIELSLERVRDVYLRMYPDGLAFKIVILSGTNGKGSTAELLASIYRQAGYRVGKFTSPHLIDFNERFNIAGQSVDDERLLAAFERVEQSRQDTPITFFEYGTLLAIDLFSTSQVDVAVMEVGLGGRLDSVNILDADVSVVTSISIDHTSWLGNTIEQIAYEKVGIARCGKPLVIGLSDAPQNMLDYAAQIGAQVSQVDTDFFYRKNTASTTWEWSANNLVLTQLPFPYEQDGVQLNNCALALKALELLSADLPVEEIDIRDGIRNASILGRCQILNRAPYIVCDVSHNETSVARLSQFLDTLEVGARGRTIAVCGMLKDKEIKASLEEISARVDEWHAATIHHERGASAFEISSLIKSLSESTVTQYDRVEDAYDAARATLTSDDCLVVFGSFHIVGDILDHVN